MTQGTPLTFEAVCAIVGRLFLESSHSTNTTSKALAELQERLFKAEKERDDALSLLNQVRKGGQ